jgi:hypothetical protein
MALQDLAGCIAATLVFATFSAKRMVPLRALGVASNIAFVAYASMAGLWPIFILHSILLPMNTVRLRQAIFCRSAAARADAGHRQDQQIAFAAANDNRQSRAQEIAISVGNLALKRRADFTHRQLDVGAGRLIGTSPVRPNPGGVLARRHYSRASQSRMDAVTDMRSCDIAPWLFFDCLGRGSHS